MYNHVIETSPGHRARLSAYAETDTAQSRCNEKVQRQVTVPRLWFVVAIRVSPQCVLNVQYDRPTQCLSREEIRRHCSASAIESPIFPLSPISLTSLYDGAAGYQAVHCWPETREVQIVTTPWEMAPGGKKSCLTIHKSCAYFYTIHCDL